MRSTSKLATRLAACHAHVRHFVVSARDLRPVEVEIGLGLRSRLTGFQQDAAAPPRVAVAGRHSAELAATLRAIRREGMVAAPVDVAGRDAEELSHMLAEAQVQLTVVAGSLVPAEEQSIKEAASCLGTSIARASRLRAEGSAIQEQEHGSPGSGSNSVPLFMFATPPSHGSGAPKVAEVSEASLNARVLRALTMWAIDGSDTVLSLGLGVESSTAVIDALEAPLSAGAHVSVHERRATDDQEAWELWEALYREKDATIAFIESTSCRKLVDAFDSLHVRIRSELQERWQRRPLRHTIALSPAGTVLAEDLTERWQEIFNTSLKWHFSCPEAGALYTVRQADSANHTEVGHIGECAPGLEIDVQEGGYMRVKGDGLFSHYHGRPRSTAKAFDEDGYFAETGHRAIQAEDLSLLPLPNVSDLELSKETLHHLTTEPNVPSFINMEPDWKVRKVPLRVYQVWRAVWGGLLLTKKHSQANIVYQFKYK